VAVPPKNARGTDEKKPQQPAGSGDRYLIKTAFFLSHSAAFVKKNHAVCMILSSIKGGRISPLMVTQPTFHI
jgi:hypothetical protein